MRAAIQCSLRWGGGLAAAVLVVWLAGAVFSDSEAPKRFDDQLGLFVRVDGGVTRWRSEGWADTPYGEHGLQRLGARILAEPGPKIILWGNSQVEALQVDERARSINVFNRLMVGRLQGFSVAGGGRNAADYYFLMPAYHRLSPDIVADVVQLNDLNDITPGGDRPRHSRFLAAPYRFQELTEVVSPTALHWWPIVHGYALDVLYYGIYRNLREHAFHWYRVPEERKGGAAAPSLSPDELRAAWTYLVRAFKARSAGRLAFIYTPDVPVPDQGVVRTRDPQAERKRLFRAVCEEEGVGFVDLTGAFLDLYRRKGLLPRGFFNSVPGAGHLNADGHRLVGEALAAYFRDGGAQ